VSEQNQNIHAILSDSGKALSAFARSSRLFSGASVAALAPKPFHGCRRNGHFDDSVVRSRKCESQKLPLPGSCHCALCRIDLEPIPLLPLLGMPGLAAALFYRKFVSPAPPSVCRG
jgi:hypothetical protein